MKGIAMNPAIAPVISGTVGAVVGFGLRAPYDAWMTRRRDHRLRREEADKALAKIRDRLYGIQAAAELVPPGVDPFDDSVGGVCKTVRDEVWDLGNEKDEYHRATDHPDPAIEMGFQRILIRHDLGAIDAMLQAISKLVGRA
ncbi:MAG: hypothetical protein ACXVKN_01285 [Acidimicrobiia bacterium]